MHYLKNKITENGKGVTKNKKNNNNNNYPPTLSYKLERVTERGKKMEKRETSFYRKKKQENPSKLYFCKGGGGKNKITIKKNIILNLQQKGYKEQGIKVLSV